EGVLDGDGGRPVGRYSGRRAADGGRIDVTTVVDVSGRGAVAAGFEVGEGLRSGDRLAEPGGAAYSHVGVQARGQSGYHHDERARAFLFRWGLRWRGGRAGRQYHGQDRHERVPDAFSR